MPIDKQITIYIFSYRYMVTFMRRLDRWEQNVKVEREREREISFFTMQTFETPVPIVNLI